MFSSPKWWIPFILILVVAVGALSYGLFFTNGGEHEHKEHSNWEQTNGNQFAEHEGHEGHEGHDGEGGASELFELLGKLAIFAGAFSFSWLMMKRIIKTKYAPLKWASKMTYKFHDWVGWIAVLFVAGHATYFLLTDFNGHHTWDGIAATIPLFALAVYGWLMKKSRHKKIMRAIHFSLAIAFLAALLFHAAGTLIQVMIIMLLAWAGVYFLNQWKSQAVK